ncbi:ABC transporter substrate-binding protein [Leeia sp. TBRC 13508]|uniref:ABC transporter substrate-binding protein n=1 Tax=Leeia speluncae TaxID=2884804 RepID=A0ABS8D591_9NEIS|nr:ABC transporter substrate-binding protein [Leeia speluncae]MCB6183163.1 ABC transporter substrate-binding protein [Leeia speluncae]
MNQKRRLLLAVLATLPLTSAFAAAPAGYPSNYQAVIDGAMKEGKLVVYSTTDTALMQPLLQDFQKAYPGIKLEYNDVNSTELYNRYISETAAGGSSADVLWSSAMDLQVKLVNDGYAMKYTSPEVKNIPDWAHWRDEVFGTTYEPISIVYNKRLVPTAEVPKTHADLVNLLNKNTAKYKGKVTTYDIEKSGTGFLFITQDAKVNPGFWNLAKAFGTVDVKLQSSTGGMMERISSGENLIGYNILGSYAITRAKKDPNIGFVMPTDYSLVISRLMFISKTAKSPNAAKLWTDYVLSRRGQSILATSADLYSVRKDIPGEASGDYLGRVLGGALKPVAVGPGLLTYLDQAKRLDFIKQWKKALGR